MFSDIVPSILPASGVQQGHHFHRLYPTGLEFPGQGAAGELRFEHENENPEMLELF